MKSESFSPFAELALAIAPLQLKPGTRLVLAYSGGVDSQVLAAGLAEFAKAHSEFNYLLVHVHHGLSDNADQWQGHCETMAAQYGLPIRVKRVEVKTGARMSLEANAREARYQALSQELTPGDLLLTAHHQDDQLETLLLALKRGLGPKGLAAMGKVQPFAEQAYLVRPLLEVPRPEIEAYAKAQGITHIEDESNQDDRFDRNFLRLEIIPALKARWPAIAQTASRSAQLCAEQQALIDEEVNARLPLMLVKVRHSVKPVLDLNLLSKQPPLWQTQLLRGFISDSGFALPSYAQLKQLLEQLLLAREDAQVEVRLDGMLVRRYRQHLYLSQAKAVATARVGFSLALDGIASGALCWSIDAGEPLYGEHLYGEYVAPGDRGDRICLRLPKTGEQVRLGFNAPGATRCHPHYRSKGRELKKLWQELALPPWERERVVLVYFDDKLVAAVGYWVEKTFVADSDQPGLHFYLK
ncbi:tRNA lysidine(34) synthetase TilS [Shewanella sp. AS1]|uniref:tRNA lysidine(34) synthetase TilS n=1 Tax=Shewanella sp. AS1 TaxID=2907626 RepID=UPI001F275BDC|nr:tRNA lysidine(34) synthetase TilS [Shewanella sp. AS1]MCE9678178.1 tRNA lysidine(34) synthetase TilS [Shewanella sp. AS1]